MDLIWQFLDLALKILGALAVIFAVLDWPRVVDQFRTRRVSKISNTERDMLRLLSVIERKGYQPNLVLAVGRGGAFLGGWLAGNLGSLPIALIDRVQHEAREGGKNLVEFIAPQAFFSTLIQVYGQELTVLVTEAATTRGNTFVEFNKLKKLYAPQWKCKYAAIYQSETTAFPADFYGKKLSKFPAQFPWHRTPKWRTFLRGDENTPDDDSR